jgi:hypothetical protein
MSPSIRNLTLFLALALFGAGCLDDSERCDPDQKYVLNLCEPDPPDAGATGADTDGAAAGAFGSLCTRGEDCTGATDTGCDPEKGPR